MVWYEYDQEECDYETWRDELPELYTCEQTKEVPVMNIMGAVDPLVVRDGFLDL